MKQSIDFVVVASKGIFPIINLVNNQLTINDVNDVLSQALGYKSYTSLCLEKNQESSYWELMLTDEFSIKLSSLFNELHHTNLSDGHYICMRKILFDTVMSNVPLSFRISELLEVSFDSVDEDIFFKERSVEFRLIIDNIVIPIIKSNHLDHVNSLAEMYKLIDLEQIEDALLQFENNFFDSESMALFKTKFTKKTECFSDFDYYTWQRMVFYPFYDVSLVFEFLMNK